MDNIIQRIRQKGTSRKGFTLPEMLIVIAIIAVLVAIAIPVFSSQMKGAQEAVDRANLRAAKSQAVTEYLLDPDASGTTIVYGVTLNGDNMVITKAGAGATGVGKSAGVKGVALTVTVANGAVTVTTWDGKIGTTSP